MMRANSAFFPRNNPSECPDNVRVPASSAWACHNPEVTADWNSDPRSSGECRIRWKATPRGAPARAPRGSGVVGDPGMCGRSLHGNQVISRLTGDTLSPASIGKVRSRSR